MAQLLTLMYHKVDDPVNQLPVDNFVKHLKSLAAQYPIVTPKDTLQPGLNICLTFDDAYCDFYYVVYPLLKALNITAILAVPTAYIQPSTSLSYEQRSQVPYPKGMDEKTCKQDVPFCTWEELKEMQASGHVIIASHSHTHASLKRQAPAQEIVLSKQILEQQLQSKIDYFVYPFGDFGKKSHQLVRQHYQLGFRIGSATNKHFKPSSQMMYRVDADRFWQSQTPIEPMLKSYQRKYWLNRIRFK